VVVGKRMRDKHHVFTADGQVAGIDLPVVVKVNVDKERFRVECFRLADNVEPRPELIREILSVRCGHHHPYSVVTSTVSGIWAITI
jgi:hypothetical protein